MDFSGKIDAWHVYRKTLEEKAMSLHPQIFDPIPAETVRIAQAAFPNKSLYMRMRDEFGSLYTDEDFGALFPRRGQPAEDPARLALVTIMQFVEGLSDRQAADAVRSRIDWKYALALELTDAGFDASVLCEFRARLIAGHAEMLLFETLLDHLRQHGLLKPRGRQRTDSTHVLAAIRTLNRLECVGETMRHALNVLAMVAPDWLQAWVPSEWFERYVRRFEEYRLPPGRPERYALAETIGTDGFQLLRAIYAPEALSWLREIPAVQVLRQIWVQQFYAPTEPVRWRTAEDLPAGALLIATPYDAEARYAKKRSTEWVGYKVHLTETCDEDTPHLITDVTTTLATTTDVDMTPIIQTQLAERQLLPSEHIVDAGYVSADHLVSSQKDHTLTLLGPAPEDPSWQAKMPEGFDVATFQINWDAQRVICPQGHASTLWMPREDEHGHAIVVIRFARTDCLYCPVRVRCTRSPSQPRQLSVRPREQYEALQAARLRQTTEKFQKDYAARAGVEGTISQAVRISDLRRSRYIGLAKTRLHHVLAATALNVSRVGAWLADLATATTRQSAFAALAPAVA
jgi:transposase